jgi:Family of unknown function (DUF5691)
MNPWETCLATALVGSDRQSPQIDSQHPALAVYAEQLQAQSLPHQLLASAGLLTLYQQAGSTPIAGSWPEATRAEDCDLANCAAATAQHLSLILSGYHRSALPELLGLLAQAQQTIPAELLPLLLEAGQRNKSLQSGISPILGARGRWLAQQNPDWDYARGAGLVDLDLETLQDLWETGGRSERRVALTAWRKHNPQEARQALMATWKQESAADRTTWLQALATNLSLEDEPFLEQALGDRGQTVREAAAELLSQLANSQYMQQMTTWVQPFVQVLPNQAGFKIVIKRPTQFEPAWAQAGLTEKPRDADTKGVATQSWWLQQLIMGADLRLWGEQISELIAALLSTNEHRAVLRGLAIAARRQNRSDWLVALLLQASNHLPVATIGSMMRQLPTEKEDWLSSALDKISSRDQLQILFESLWHDHQGWGLELSQALLKKIWAQIELATPQDQYRYEGLERSFKELCYRLAVEVLPLLRGYLSQLSAQPEPVYGQDFLQACIEILEFRQSLQASFKLNSTEQQVEQTHDPPLQDNR